MEEDLEHIQSLFNEAQDSWKEAEERPSSFCVVLASKRKIQVQKSALKLSKKLKGLTTKEISRG